MGIKFHCPNGHKLNVKAFLAGKKGVCPKCGTKFRIPAESEPGLVDSDLEEQDAGASGIKSGDGAKPGNGAPVAVQPQPGLAAVPGPAATAASSTSAPPGAPADPIAAAPQLIWYVRPPSGGQFGPAKGDIMRTWLSEGRVTGDSLVWREGWTDWQTAGNIFPSLNSAAAPQTTAPQLAAPESLAGLTTTAAPKHMAQLAGKKGTSGMAVAILVGLGLLCLVLVAVLAFVLTTVK